MDGKTEVQSNIAQKAKIILDYAEEECIDIAIAFTPACGLFVILQKGLQQVKSDIDAMDEHIDFLSKPQEGVPEQDLKNLTLQATSERSVAVLAYNNGVKLIKELQAIIIELEPTQNKKKILIHKPTWSDPNNT